MERYAYRYVTCAEMPESYVAREREQAMYRLAEKLVPDIVGGKCFTVQLIEEHRPVQGRVPWVRDTEHTLDLKIGQVERLQVSMYEMPPFDRKRYERERRQELLEAKQKAMIDAVIESELEAERRAARTPEQIVDEFQVTLCKGWHSAKSWYRSEMAEIRRELS